MRKAGRFLLLCIALSLFTPISNSCAPMHPTVTPELKAQFMEDLKAGKLTLTCEAACTWSWVENFPRMVALHNASQWEQLAELVMQVGFEEDLSYYFLGRSAEGLGYFDSAEKYYKHSLYLYNAPNTVVIKHCRENKSLGCGGIDLITVLPERLASVKTSRNPQSAPPEIQSTVASRRDRPERVGKKNTKSDASAQLKITGSFDVGKAMKLIYGNYDTRSKTSRLNSHKMPDQDEFTGWKDYRNLVASVAMEAPYADNLSKRHVIVTKVVPLDEDFDCRSCVPIVGAFVFAEQNGAWVLEHGEQFVTTAGGVGEAPDCKLTQIGPGKYGLMCESGTGGIGYNGRYALLLIPHEKRMIKALWHDTRGTNAGFEEKEDDVFDFAVEIKFVPGSNPDFYDVQTITTGTKYDGKAGEIVSADGTELYALRDGKYVKIK